MDEERATEKAKKFVVEGSKKDKRKNRWKKAVEKDLLVRGLKRTDALDLFFWSLGCKNRLTPACG